MSLDQPWKIAAVIGLLAFLRIVWGLWRTAPGRTFMVELLDSGLIAFILVFMLVRPFVVQAFYIPSASMENFLRTGDHLLVNKLYYGPRLPIAGTRWPVWGEIHRGDSVGVRPPHDPGREYIKRGMYPYSS